MKIEKKVVANLSKCYEIAPLTLHGQKDLLVAAEKRDPCLLLRDDGTLLETVWEQPGGVMTMVQVPGTDGIFLATQMFYSPNDSAMAKIVIAERKEGVWDIRTLTELPFVHRFESLTRNGVNYLVACTLKSDHEYKDDWRFPGKVYTAVLPRDLSGFCQTNQLPLTVLREGLLKNHGYVRHMRDGVNYGLICCENGIFAFIPPEREDGSWKIEEVADIPASDAVLLDFNGDGEDELAVIYHFHGDKVIVFQKQDGAYQPVWETDAPFAHAICRCELRGKPTAVFGARKGDRELFALRWNPETSNYEKVLIDQGCGAANVFHFVRNGKDVLIATNREVNEVAMYTVTED